MRFCGIYTGAASASQLFWLFDARLVSDVDIVDQPRHIKQASSDYANGFLLHPGVMQCLVHGAGPRQG